MAKRFTIEILMNLAKAIGANPSKFIGTRTNITFLGKGPTKNPLFQGPVAGLEGASEAQLGSKDSIIGAVEDAMGFASAQKLNSIQIQALGINLENILKVYKPPVLPMASVTDIRPGILGAEALKKFPKESHKFFGRPLKRKDFDEIDQLIIEGKLPDARGRTWDFKTPKAGAGDLPQKTASARATLYRLLDMPASKEGVGLTLREIMSKQDLKWLLEGGGGAEGDPIAMFAKYYGNASAKQLPSATTPAVIAKFAKEVIKRKDRLGRRIDDPYFNREDLDFAGGGLAHILQVPTRSGMRIGGLGLLTRGIRSALKRTRSGYDEPGVALANLEHDASYLMSPVNMQKIKKLEIYRKQLVRDLLRKEGGGEFTHGPKPEATRADLELLDDYIAKLKNKIKEVGYYGEGAGKEKALLRDSPYLPFPKFVRDKYRHAEGGRAGYSKGRLVKSAIAILNRNKKNAKYMFNASDNVSPGYAAGDMKYNAELLADQLAEDAGVVYADLGDLERTKFYGTAYDYLAKEMGEVLSQKRMMNKLLAEVDESMTRQALYQWKPGKGRKPSASGGLAGILEV